MKTEEKLHMLRKEKGITQAELAEIMDVSRQAVSRWESGVVTPSIENLKRLSSLYGVPLDYLLNEREGDSSQTKNGESFDLDVVLNSQLEKKESSESNNKEIRRKQLIVKMLLVIMAILIIIGIVVSTVKRNRNGGIEYNEMKSDNSWTYSSENGEFDLQWYIQTTEKGYCFTWMKKIRTEQQLRSMRLK